MTFRLIVTPVSSAIWKAGGIQPKTPHDPMLSISRQAAAKALHALSPQNDLLFPSLATAALT